MPDADHISQTWRGRSAFVTGAYGLLGGWLVKALLNHGARVTVLKRDDVAASGLVLERTDRVVNIVHGDVCDARLIERALGEYEVDTVFHLAAQAIVGVANRGPTSTFETNIRGAWTVLEACRRAGVTRTIVASSDKAYGPHDELPYRESLPLQPIYPYDVSKAAADMLARSYWHTFGLPVAVTRFANLYGGGDFNFSRLVPEAIVAAIERRAPVIRSDGTPERDFLYVEDAVAAYLAIADALDDGPAAGEAFNAGPGSPRSVLEVVRLICELAGTGVEPDVRGSGTPSGEVSCQWVDSAKLRAATGWEPRVALEDGLERTIAWYREHLHARAGA
ncbi:MAG TPA: NAD-dependent epimerase/dehydratase family protein [Solirubrobacteraceae bacterium]|nr:NAD-dependent epimerase/dehydratase family protein [Solirubrobacteraceae bacterium]